MCVCVCVVSPLRAGCQPTSAVCGGAGSVAVGGKEEVQEEQRCYVPSQSSPQSFPEEDHNVKFNASWYLYL